MSPARDDDEDDSYDEGTLSPAEVEARANQRSQSTVPIGNIENIEHAEIHLQDGLGVSHWEDSLSNLLDDHFHQIKSLIRWLVLLVGLIIIALVLWRIESIEPLVDLIAGL